MIIAGTRPEVIKLAPVLRGLEEENVNYLFVWSGQHYDYLLSQRAQNKLEERLKRLFKF